MPVTVYHPEILRYAAHLVEAINDCTDDDEALEAALVAAVAQIQVAARRRPGPVAEASRLPELWARLSALGALSSHAAGEE